MTEEEFIKRFGATPEQKLKAEGDKLVTAKCLIDVLTPFVQLLNRLEKRDAASLLNDEAMRRAEKRVTEIRNHCSEFLYHRSTAAMKDGTPKGLPTWLK
jgi:hypothetical protein